MLPLEVPIAEAAELGEVAVVIRWEIVTLEWAIFRLDKFATSSDPLAEAAELGEVAVVIGREIVTLEWASFRLDKFATSSDFEVDA